jgi:Phage integrase family
VRGWDLAKAFEGTDLIGWQRATPCCRRSCRPSPPRSAARNPLGSYVVPGDDPEKPRADLKRPWEAVAKRAGLDGVRLHDLRHTYASFGAGGGLGLPIIGKLLGHTQASTTQRYAHLDADPLRRASEAIGGRIAAALDGKHAGSVVRLKDAGRHEVAIKKLSRTTGKID